MEAPMPELRGQELVGMGLRVTTSPIQTTFYIILDLLGIVGNATVVGVIEESVFKDPSGGCNSDIILMNMALSNLLMSVLRNALLVISDLGLEVILALIMLFIGSWGTSLISINYFIYNRGSSAEFLLVIARFANTIFNAISSIVLAVGHRRLRAVIKYILTRKQSPRSDTDTATEIMGKSVERYYTCPQPNSNIELYGCSHSSNHWQQFLSSSLRQAVLTWPL